VLRLAVWGGHLCGHPGGAYLSSLLLLMWFIDLRSPARFRVGDEVLVTTDSVVGGAYYSYPAVVGVVDWEETEGVWMYRVDQEPGVTDWFDGSCLDFI